MLRHALTITCCLLIAAPVSAGPIQKACMSSDRSAATRALCSCIQGVADEKLSGSEQRKAADFFADPQLAQDTKMSKDPKQDRFWDRYTAWTQRAAKVCG